MPLRTLRAFNTYDIHENPPEEVRTLRLRRHQLFPKNDLSRIDLVTDPRPGLITKATPVGTIGSCFASRLQDWLTDYGYNFVRTERDPYDPESYACHTARFGQVFNTGCHAQVFESALGRFLPQERFWHSEDGRVLDPYRKSIWWGSEEQAEADLRAHAKAVREAVERAEVFIVTPGVAEVWKSRADGSTFAQAPPKDVFSPERHLFELTSVEENIENLERMYRVMREINPGLQVIVTVSPVPLLATFRDTHCVLADTVSKATLRVAVDRFCARNPEVIYFPSYEIVQRLHPQPFEHDNLHIKYEMVEKIMVAFMTAYGDLGAEDSAVA